MTERLGVGKAKLREVLWRAELASGVETATTNVGYPAMQHDWAMQHPPAVMAWRHVTCPGPGNTRFI